MRFDPQPYENLAPGVLFADRYELIRILGQGGFAKVFLAQDRTLEIPVALKLLNPALAIEERQMRRFKREVIVARTITHRNVCKIYDIGQSGDILYLTMEFLDGQELFAILGKGKPLPIRVALNIACQLCAALDAAHREGVVHRDLKPNNIILDKKGTVKILDFGIARFGDTTGVTDVGVMMGTPSYMAPEQCRGEHGTAQSDLYSLGVLMYQMFTGVRPFVGDTPLAVLYQHLNSAPRPPIELRPDMPPGQNELILRCLAKDPSSRHPSARQLLHDLQAIFHTVAQTAGPDTPEQTPPGGSNETSLPSGTPHGMRRLPDSTPASGAAPAHASTPSVQTPRPRTPPVPLKAVRPPVEPEERAEGSNTIKVGEGAEDSQTSSPVGVSRDGVEEATDGRYRTEPEEDDRLLVPTRIDAWSIALATLGLVVLTASVVLVVGLLREDAAPTFPLPASTPIQETVLAAPPTALNASADRAAGQVEPPRSHSDASSESSTPTVMGSTDQTPAASESAAAAETSAPSTSASVAGELPEATRTVAPKDIQPPAPYRSPVLPSVTGNPVHVAAATRETPAPRGQSEAPAQAGADPRDVARGTEKPASAATPRSGAQPLDSRSPIVAPTIRVDRVIPPNAGTPSAAEILVAESKLPPRSKGRLSTAKGFALAESVARKSATSHSRELPRTEGRPSAEAGSGNDRPSLNAISPSQGSSQGPQVLEPTQPAFSAPTPVPLAPTPVPSPTPVPPTWTPVPTNTPLPSPTEPPTKTFTPEPTHLPVPKPGQDIVLVDAPEDATLCVDGSPREFARVGASIRGRASAGQRRVGLVSRSRGFAIRSLGLEVSDSAVEIRFDDPDWSPSRYKVTLRVAGQHQVVLERRFDDLEPIRLPFVDESVRIEVQASESKLVVVRDSGHRLEKVCTWQGVDGCNAPPVLRCGSIIVP